MSCRHGTLLISLFLRSFLSAYLTVLGAKDTLSRSCFGVTPFFPLLRRMSNTIIWLLVSFSSLSSSLNCSSDINFDITYFRSYGLKLAEFSILLQTTPTISTISYINVSQPRAACRGLLLRLWVLGGTLLEHPTNSITRCTN